MDVLVTSPNFHTTLTRIEELPAEDAAPVVYGEWKWSHGGECSECGFHNSNFDYRYCPMCGARMDGGPDA